MQRRADSNTGRTRFPVQVALAIVAAILAYHYVDPDALIQALYTPSPGLVAVLLVLATLDRFLMAWKWLLLLRAIEIQARFTTVLAAYYQAGIVSRLTPSSIGGDLFRAYALSRRHANRWDRILASITVEKVTAVFSSLAIATAGLAVLGLSGNEPADMAGSAVFLLSGGAVASFGYWLSSQPGLGRLITRSIPSERIGRFLGRIHAAYLVFVDDRPTLMVNTLLAGLANLIQVLIVYGAARSVGVELGALTLVAILALGQFLKKFGIVFEGFLLGEMLLIMTATLGGIDHNQAVAFALISSSMLLLGSAPGLIFFLPRWRRPAPGTPDDSPPGTSTRH